MNDSARRPQVFSIVGLQDAGKTTLVVQMVEWCKRQGWEVAVIKHDGHADERGLDDWEKPGSDTKRYANAGAAFTMVGGGGRTLLRAENRQEPLTADRLYDEIVTYSRNQGRVLDVVLVEGFKHSSLPKIVIVRRESDVEWFHGASLSPVAAVVCPAALRLLAGVQSPVYDEKDVEQLCRNLLMPESPVAP